MQGVNPRGLQEGLRLLAEGGTPARLLIIDDGWQSMGACWGTGWAVAEAGSTALLSPWPRQRPPCPHAIPLAGTAVLPRHRPAVPAGRGAGRAAALGAARRGGRAGAPAGGGAPAGRWAGAGRWASPQALLLPGASGSCLRRAPRRCPAASGLCPAPPLPRPCRRRPAGGGAASRHGAAQPARQLGAGPGGRGRGGCWGGGRRWALKPPGGGAACGRPRGAQRLAHPSRAFRPPTQNPPRHPAPPARPPPATTR